MYDIDNIESLIIIINLNFSRSLFDGTFIFVFRLDMIMF